MKIKVLYYAMLRDFAGKNEESLEVESLTAQQLFDFLKEKYRFPLSIKDLQVAINENYSKFDDHLKDNDTVVFLPPIAGG